MDIIDEFIEHYVREYDYYLEAARICAQQCEDELIQNGIRAIVTHRAKRVDRLRDKLERRNTGGKYTTLDSVYQDIVDLSGVRIALYFPGDRVEVQRIIESTFIIQDAKKDFPEKLDAQPNHKKRFSGYWATHYRVCLKEDRVQEIQKRYCGAHIEIQIASVLMHGWAEVEHDLVYKPQTGNLSEDEYAILDQINGLVLSGELALELLQRAIKSRSSEKAKTFRNHYELSSYLYNRIRAIFPDKSSEPTMGRADVLFRFLQLANLDYPGAIEDLVSTIDQDTEKRSISDQLVDAILDNDQEKLNLYRQALDEIDSRNPYSKVDRREKPYPDEAPVGQIVNRWKALENAIRDIAELHKQTKRYPNNVNIRQVLKQVDSFPKESVDDVFTIRAIRNLAVHGRQRITVEDSQKVESAVDRILQLWKDRTDSVEERSIIEKALTNVDSHPERKDEMGRFELEEFKGLKIYANRVPDKQFDTNGFGWALVIREKQTDNPVFFAVVKSFRTRPTPENIDQALELIKSEVHLLIEKGSPYKEYYCYQWEPEGPERMPFSEGDCDVISPGEFRSPFM